MGTAGGLAKLTCFWELGTGEHIGQNVAASETEKCSLPLVFNVSGGVALRSDSAASEFVSLMRPLEVLRNGLDIRASGSSTWY
jgi:hypothetical protein